METPDSEAIERMLAAGGLKRIGIGTRRACYILPGGGLCLKCYRSEAEIAEGKYPGTVRSKPLLPTVVNEIRRCRSDEKRNTGCQEYRYYLKLKARLPGELMAAFPSTMEMVDLPSRGWATIEEAVVNADGSAPRRFAEEWMVSDGAKRERLFAALNSLVDALVENTVRFFDPQNVLVQDLPDGDFRLRITDFEPATRMLIPIDSIPAFTRSKVRRRFLRFMRDCGIERE